MKQIKEKKRKISENNLTKKYFKCLKHEEIIQNKQSFLAQTIEVLQVKEAYTDSDFGCNMSTFPGFPLALFIFALFTRMQRLPLGQVSPFHERVTGVFLTDVSPYDTAACPTLQCSVFKIEFMRNPKFQIFIP